MITHTWSRKEIDELIAEARTWIDVRFRHQGRSRAGVDCIGLLAACAAKNGLKIELPTNYTMHVEPKRLIEDLRKYFEEIPVSRAIVGDMLVIRFSGRATHLVLRTDKGIIHSSSEFRKVVEHGYDEEWRRRSVVAFRLPGRYMGEDYEKQWVHQKIAERKERVKPCRPCRPRKDRP